MLDMGLTMPTGVVPVMIGPLSAIIPILWGMLVFIAARFVAMFKPASLKMGAKILWRNKIGTVLTVAIVFGVIRLGGFLLAQFGPEFGEIEGGQADWPMFRGGLHRRGYVQDDFGEPLAPGHNWAFTRDTRMFYSSPTVVGNRVFISSIQGLSQFNQQGRGAIYCLDADTGAVIWRYQPRDFRGTFSSVSVLGDYVAFGEGLHITKDARITVLRLIDDGRNYEFLWEYRTSCHVESTPAIYDGKVFVGAGDDGLYCIALDPLPGNQPNILWRLTPEEGYHDVESSPAAADGKVWFGLGIDGHAVVCADANTGKERWRTPTPYPVFGHPTIVSNRLYVGMGTGDFIFTAEQVRETRMAAMRSRGASQEELDAAFKALAPAGAVWCLDADNGEVLWKRERERNVLGAVAAADGRLYFGDRAGVITSVTYDNQALRERRVNEPVIASPAVSLNYVYAVTTSGKLYVMDKTTLEPIWDMQLGSAGLYLSSPAVARGQLYVGTEADGLISVGEPVTERRRPVWGGPLGGPGRSGWLDRSPLAPRAIFAWRYPADDDADADGNLPEISGPPAYAGDSLLVGLRGARTGLAKLKLLEERDGYEADWFLPTSHAPASGPAVGEQYAYFVAGKPGDDGRLLQAVRLDTGAEAGRLPVTDGASGRLLLSETALWVHDADNRLSRYDVPPDGSAPWSADPRWTAEISEPVGCPVFAHDMVFVVSRANRAAMALSDANGAPLWQAALPAEPTTGMIAAGNRLAVGTAEGVVVLDARDGAMLWHSNVVGSVTGNLVCDSAMLGGASDGGRVWVFTWDGEPVLDKTDTTPGIAPMIAGDRILYFIPNAIEYFDAASGETVRPIGRIGWMGQAVTPAIQVDSRLYFVTEKRGLVCARPR